jgi:phosphoglycerate dehydrogenase-like enzyme
VEATNPLLGLPNAHLSPHIASATDHAKREMSWVVRDAWRVLSGQPPEFPARPK